MQGKGIPKVLIVEDDHTVLGFLCRALERAGYQVIGVGSGVEALAAVRAPGGVDAVLIDGILPDMHGVRLADAILDEPAATRVPLCFVTGAVRDGSPSRAGVGALAKPVRLRELEQVVAGMLIWGAGPGSPVAARRASLRRVEQGFLVGR